MYFKASTQHIETGALGKRKRVKEAFLVEGVNWTDAETTTYRELADARDDFAIKGIVPLKLSDIVFAEPEEHDVEDWYLCKVEWITENDKGKEKRISNVMLINAKSVQDANERIGFRLKDFLVPFEIKKVDKSKILEVFLLEKEESEANKKPDLVNG